MTRRDRVEHVADVHAGDRARRALQRRCVRARQRDHRTMHAILDARSHQTDHTLMPGLVEQAQTERQRRIFGAHVRDREHRFLLHLQLELATVVIELREPRREHRAPSSRSSVSRHWMPIDMSSSRPAAFRRGPT